MAIYDVYANGLLASWFKGNTHLENGIVAELEGHGDAREFRAALANYAAMLPEMELLDERLAEQLAIDKKSKRDPGFERALGKILAEAGALTRLDLHRVRYANAGGTKAGPKPAVLTNLPEILQAQRDDLTILRKKLPEVIDGLRAVLPIAEKREFVAVMLSGRNGFADKMPEFTDLMSAYDRFATQSCMLTIDATMQAYPSGLGWLKSLSRPAADEAPK